MHRRITEQKYINKVNKLKYEMVNYENNSTRKVKKEEDTNTATKNSDKGNKT